MRRYIDFRADEWADRTDSRMQAARWAACMEGLGTNPPQPGVIDSYPEDLLFELIGEGFVSLENPPRGEMLRPVATDAVMATLKEDAACLSQEEHTLVERMLISGRQISLESVAEMEAAYTLRMRLWCDLGIQDDEPTAYLDPALMEALPALMMTTWHQERRARAFIYDGMLHGLLYMHGYLTDKTPRLQFIADVLGEDVSPATERLARNYLEASFDTYRLPGCNLLVHEGFADPEVLSSSEALEAGQQTLISAGSLAASMNGLLPQEMLPDEKLQRALLGALRPEYEPSEASTDLRLLVKQDAPAEVLTDIMTSMLCVIPTPHMHGALQELRLHTPRWITRDQLPPQTAGTTGVLH